MMLSESQERMLMVLKPDREQQAEAIFSKWGLDFAVVGHTHRASVSWIRHSGEVEADLPIKAPRRRGAASYDRPLVEAEPPHRS